MLPYPSSSFLHLGHFSNYALIDSYCNYLRYIGQTVFQPFGYDAFGLPAENYARKIGGDPKEITYNNIASFRKQMEMMNTKYEEILVTCEPNYYKWTQWIFLKLLEKGLAYKKLGIVNYCLSCETTLANEQVVDNKCERCESFVEQKELNQWYFKITDYKERLIKNLDWLDFPESTKNAQRVWLESIQDWCVSRQRKFGTPIPIEGEKDTLDTFVDSSFYFLRYLDPHNEHELVSKEKYRQVDLYVGGAEHAQRHLIFSRFINMVLFDMGYVGCEEPFKKVIHQGMITKDGLKMSKTKGNVINPDNYDQDFLRFFIMFLGHYFQGGDWKEDNYNGIPKFIKRLNVWFEKIGDVEIDFTEFKKTIFTYTESFKFNKVVSSFMIFYNENKNKNLSIESKKEFIELLKIYMPRIDNKIRII